MTEKTSFLGLKRTSLSRKTQLSGQWLSNETLKQMCKRTNEGFSQKQQQRQKSAEWQMNGGSDNSKEPRQIILEFFLHFKSSFLNT